MVGSTSDVTFGRSEGGGSRPALQPDETVYARFFNASNDLFCIADGDGYFRYLSEGWAEALGYTKDELQRVPFIDFVHPDDRTATIEAADRLAAGENVVLFENRYRCKDGTYRFLKWNATHDGAQELVYATARDVTRLRHAEEARIRIFRMACHDLAAPVTALGARLAALEHKGHADEGDIAKLVGMSRRLRRLTMDVQAAAALEHDEIPINPVDIDLRDITGEVVDELRPHAEKQGVQLQVDGPQVGANADPHRVGQVIYNLVHNSLKFSPDGANTTVELDDRDRHVVVSVRDQGRGLTEEESSRLFQPFTQVHEVHESKEQGTGLGLYICRRIMEAHGGTISVHSEGHGTGATFTVSLPRKDS